jgi:hypothetical protein
LGIAIGDDIGCKKYSSKIIFCICSGLLFELKEVLQSLQKYLFIPLLESLKIIFLDLLLIKSKSTT